MDQIVTHLSSVSCYFFDPEGNRTEVFWLTGRPSVGYGRRTAGHPTLKEEVLADVDRIDAKDKACADGRGAATAAIAAMQEATEAAREKLAATA